MFVHSTFDFGIEAAEGMAYLHSMQPPLLHRDLKTLNLMVTSDMKIKVGSVSLLLLCFFPSHHKQVGDFGLSIFDNATKKEGSVTGTAAYLAPETLEGVSFTLKSDVCTPSSLLSSLPTTSSLLLPSLTPPPSSHPPPTSPSSIANYTTTGLCFCCCLLGISQLDTETYVPEPFTKTKTKQKQNKNNNNINFRGVRGTVPRIPLLYGHAGNNHSPHSPPPHLLHSLRTSISPLLYSCHVIRSCMLSRHVTCDLAFPSRVLQQ